MSNEKKTYEAPFVQRLLSKDTIVVAPPGKGPRRHKTQLLKDEKWHAFRADYEDMGKSPEGLADTAPEAVRCLLDDELRRANPHGFSTASPRARNGVDPRGL